MSDKFSGHKKAAVKSKTSDPVKLLVEPKPTVVQIIPGDADGLISLADSLKDLDVEIPLWSQKAPPGAPNPDVLYLEWLPEGEDNYVAVAEPELVPGTVLAKDFPLKRTIPYRYFQNRTGSFKFRFRLDLWMGSTAESEDTTILIDRLGPVFVDAEPQIVVSEALITDVTLGRDKGVICEIPEFTELRPEQVKAAVAWLDEIVDTLPDVGDLDFFDLLPSNRLITIPEAKVRGLGSGLHYVMCVLIDKAGNQSTLTLPTKVMVALGALPTGLQPPKVPQADGDGITRQDASEGVKVHIESFSDYEDNDGIVIDWGGERTAPIAIAQLLPFDLKVPVPWSLMKGLYNFTTGGDQSVDVKYEVLRGEHPIASGPITVPVNFAYTGPENPDEPHPVNPLLEKVVIWGASTIQDTLVASDEGKDAKAKIKLYDSPTPGDVLTVYWNGVVLSSPPYTVTGTESPNQEIELVVPWVDIAPNPINLKLPVYYTVAVPGSKNPQSSQSKDINVQAVSIMLPDPEYQVGSLGFYGCVSLIENNGEWGVEVLIPTSTYLTMGADVTLVWRSYYGDGLTEIVGAELIYPSYPVTVDEQNNGIRWFIPFEKHLKPTYGGNSAQYGYGRCQYQIVVNGKPILSTSTAVMIAMGRGGAEDSCEIPPPPRNR
ncbi:hypothetical protein SB766_01565 [Pseudomonas sp. SIMBA_077]